MQSLAFTINPATPWTNARTRLKARRTVTKTVTIPEPAPWWQQIVAMLLLIGLIVVAGVIAVQVDNAGIRVATGAVILLAAIAIILWAAAILQTGLDLKQILAILKAFFDAVKDAQGSTDGGAEAGGTPSPGRGTT